LYVTKTSALPCFFMAFFRNLSVPLASRLRDEAFQHLTLVVHGPVEKFRASIEILLPGGWISHRSR
jgi:hypothetical protein